MRLRFQLAILLVVAIVGTMAAAMVLTVRLTRTALEADARDAAVEAAEDIARDIEALPFASTEEEIEKHLETALRKHRRLTEIELSLEAGEGAVAQYSLRSKSHSVAKKQKEQVLRRGPRTISATTREPGVRGIEVSTPLEGTLGRGRLDVTLSLETVDRIVEIESRMGSSVAAVAMFVALILALFAADRVVGRPLARLATTMGEVSRGDLDRRVQTGGPPEIQRVSDAFNVMLDRLQEADRAVRSFNDRLGAEVRDATRTLSERNTALAHLNQLLVRTRDDLAHKERLAALGQLAAQLAHEVGTPLGSVSGHLQLLLADPAVPSGVRDRLVIASQEIGRVGRIIRDYLDATRRVEPEVSDVDVARTVSESVDVARGANPARKAAIDVEVSPEAATWRTDSGALRQILVNLIANGFDASAARDGEPGTVSVRVGVEEFTRSGRARQELVVEVTDTGVGMSAEALGRLFEPFYTTKGRGRGTGLGLAISRELALRLGGGIEAASELGRGSTFTVRLPDGDETARRAQAVASATVVFH